MIDPETSKRVDRLTSDGRGGGYSERTVQEIRQEHILACYLDDTRWRGRGPAIDRKSRRDLFVFSRFCPSKHFAEVVRAPKNTREEYRELVTIPVMSETPYPLLDPTSLSPPLNTLLVTDDAGLYDMAEYLESIDTIGYDIETNMADDFIGRKTRTIQLGDRYRQYVIDLLAFAGSEEAMLQQGHRTAPAWAESLRNVVGRFVEDGRYLKVGQNLAFEHETLLWNLGIRGWSYYDTMIAEKVLLCGVYPLFAKDVFGLKDLVARYYKLSLSKKEQTGFDLHTLLRQEQVEYAGLDIRLPLRIRDLQLDRAKKAGLTRGIQVQLDSIPAFSEMRVNGMYVDQDEWNTIVDSNEVLHRQHVAELDKSFVPIFGSKTGPMEEMEQAYLGQIERRWRDEEDREKRKEYRKAYQEAARTFKARFWAKAKWEGDAAVNYASDDDILKGLHRLGYKVVATNEKALSRIKNEPVIVALFNYRETKKALSTYGRQFLQYISPVTGRVHSSFNQLGAETGRTSSTRPNVQQLPPPNRRCVKARDGYVIITCDMSGAELRIIAELANDAAWIRMFEQGWDVHSVNAEMIYGDEWLGGAEDDCEYYRSKQKCSCKKHKTMRGKIKTINFGIVYGMSEYALAAILDISTSEARDLLNKWKEVNSVIATYLAQSAADAKTSLEARTFSGFRRKFRKPDWEWAKQIAIERRLQDKGDRDIEAKDISKVWNGAWGSIEREGTNTPVQGSNADVAKVAMGAGSDKNGKEFMWHILPRYGAYLINFVHDEFVIECPAEHATECEEEVKDCIRRAGAEFMSRVVMEAEANISERWEKD
jgi:DNA polymerase-1